MQPTKVRSDSSAGRRWPRRLALGTAIALVTFTLVGFVVVPPLGKHLAQEQLGELLGRKVTIERVRVNPFALSLTVEGFRIFEPDGNTPFIGFSRLYVNAQLSSVFRMAPVVKEIRLESPRVHVVRLKATSDAWADMAAYNFSDIVARLDAAKKPEAPPVPPDAAPPRFSLNNIRLIDGAISYEDRPLGTRHDVTEFSVGVPFVSTLPVYLDSFVEPGLSVRVDGTPFAVKGRTKPFTDSLETVLELRVQALDLTRYVPFVPLTLPFSIESARLTLGLDVSFVRSRADAQTLKVTGRVALDKLDVREKVGGERLPLVALNKFELVMGEADLTAQRFRIDKVLLSGLDVHVRRDRGGVLNLERMVPSARKPPVGASRQVAEAPIPDQPKRGQVTVKPGKADAGPQFSVGTFTLEKAEVHLQDRSVSPAFDADVRDIALSLRGLSNAPGATADVTAGLRAEPGGTVSQKGTLRLTPLSATGSITVDGIEPARFSPYYRNLIAFEVLKGRMRLGADYGFEEGRGPPAVKISGAFVELAELALRRRDARDDFFRLGQLSIRGATVDLAAHNVSIATITTRDGRVRAGRDDKGVLDLTTLVPEPTSPVGAGAAPGGVTTALPAAKKHQVPAPKAPADVRVSGDEPASEWTVNLARFDLEKWSARFEDRAVKPAAVLTVDPITLHVTNVSTTPGAKLGVDARLGINKTGRLMVTGASTLPPVAANLRFDLRALEILPLQPYFSDQVSLTVTGGAVSVKGQVAVKTPAAAAEPRVDLDADFDVTDLSTVDGDKKEKLLAWKSLHVGGLRLASPEVAVAIKDVALTDFHARLVLFPDAHFNLQDAFAPAGSSAKPTANAGAKDGADQAANTARPAGAAPSSGASSSSSSPRPPQISIGQVTLQGGHVLFNDRLIRPSYAAELTELTGRVSGLSSKPDSTADVDIRGSVDRSGVLTIAGKANPLAQDLFVDLQVRLRDFELPPTSPYAGKFAGYGISKGKLGLSLDYKIANRRLDAKNHLLLDQFTFGDKVESPDAVNLPVRLAVALLKDRHGVIDIDLPIAGSLDDPEFKVWRAVVKVLGNLLVKAVTAPFSLIAAAFGGGDELSRVDFASGVAALDDKAKKKLEGLGKALRERPGISFELEGGADPKQDREGLRRTLLERKLKAQKLAELVQAGAAVASVEQVVLDAAERSRLLEKAYGAEKFPKPKQANGAEKSVPPEEMEKLMLVNTKVEDDDLRALALRRATAVQANLMGVVQGSAGRLFLVTPRVGGAGGRVEFKLKKD